MRTLPICQVAFRYGDELPANEIVLHTEVSVRVCPIIEWVPSTAYRCTMSLSVSTGCDNASSDDDVCRVRWRCRSPDVLEAKRGVSARDHISPRFMLTEVVDSAVSDAVVSLVGEIMAEFKLGGSDAFFREFARLRDAVAQDLAAMQESNNRCYSYA